MQDKENCLAIIRAILPELNITSISYKEPQHEVKQVTSTRGVRFDAVVKDDQERYYDVEMQVENTGDLGRRTRYYQSQIDNETLLKGQNFHQLKESYVIFLCAFDPFGYGMRRYQFHQYEDDHKELQLGTQSHVIFINAKGTKGEVTNDLAGIIDVMNQRANHDNPLATKLVNEIDYYNQDPRKRRELMDYATKLDDERRLGQKQGEREATLRTVKSVIYTMNEQGIERSYIFRTAKKAANGEMTDQQIIELIDESRKK